MLRKALVRIIGISMVLFTFIALSGCANTTLVNTQTIDLDGVDRINIAYTSDHIIFYKSETQQLIIKEYMSQNNAKYYADISTSGSNVIIKSGDRPLSFQSYIEVYLPISYTGNLSINTKNGAIYLKETYTFNDVNIKADNGAVIFEDIAANILDIQTSNGEVTLNKVSAQTIISTDNGKIRVNNGIGSGTFETSSGKLEIQYNDVIGNIGAQSTSGKIQLSIPQTLSFQFNATSNTGNIKTAFSDLLTISKETVYGTVGDNPEIDIRLSTSSGDIQVDYK